MFSLQWFFQLRSIGYLELGKRVYHKVIEEECSEHAAAMAFFILTLWVSSTAVISMMKAMNKVCSVQEGRPFWKVRLTAFSLVIGLSLLFFLALVLLIFGSKIVSLITAMLNLGVVFRITRNLMIIPVVDRARHGVYLETYIYEKNATGRRIADALKRCPLQKLTRGKYVVTHHALCAVIEYNSPESGFKPNGFKPNSLIETVSGRRSAKIV